MTRRDAALLLVLGAVWGAVFPLASFVLEELAPVPVAVVRTGLSALLLIPLAARSGALWRALRHRPGPLLTASVLQMAVPVLLLTSGQAQVTAGVAGVLLGTQPVWAALLATVLDRQLDRATTWGVLVGAAGTVALFWNDLHGPSTLLGGTQLVAAAACYAAGALYIQRAMPDVPPLVVAATVCSVSCLLLAPALAFTPLQVPSGAVGVWLIVLGTVATGGALVLFYTLVDRIGAVRANLAAYLAPGFAVLYDIPLGHQPTPSTLTGLALILTASALATHPSPRTTTATAEHG
ncbi:DMT family transporter [Streptomyces albipurpureus]|uniref:DMT family transporter n=1 Tax=Streptomyces albipurpureus TaxID=2897419 RepID=A0ABT0UZV0_9ACTN|nr:DMT family transporter [Streptomyces sp. CWNU-1]MCM2393620.1 DMT family transporter [Streptomyces sp. CWNU-1]